MEGAAVLLRPVLEARQRDVHRRLQRGGGGLGHRRRDFCRHELAGQFDLSAEQGGGARGETRFLQRLHRIGESGKVGGAHGGRCAGVGHFILRADKPGALNFRAKLARKEKIPGFGHRVYHTEDPRATHLRQMSKDLGQRSGQTIWYEMSQRIEALVKTEKKLNPNVDFYSASTYHALGIATDLFTPIFAVSRISGWTAHVLEQYASCIQIEDLFQRAVQHHSDEDYPIGPFAGSLAEFLSDALELEHGPVIGPGGGGGGRGAAAV